MTAEILPSIVMAGAVVAGGFVGYGMLRQKVADHERATREALVDLRARVEKAETAANDVKGLAGAVEHMGERFSDQMRHLVEVVGLKFDHLNTQVAGLEREVRVKRRGGQPRQIERAN